MKPFFRRFLRDDSGQAITEYILLLSATVIGTTALVRGILSALDKGVLILGSQLEKDLKTGRAGLGIWRN